MSVVPSTVGTLQDFAEELLAAAVLALDSTPAGCPTRRYVSPGQPAIDCEQVTVTADPFGNDVVSPSSPPQAVAHQFGSGLLIYVSLTVMVARCVPSIDGRKLPTPAAMQAAARTMNEDAWAIFNTLVTMKDRGDLFGGRCSGMYVDNAIPLTTEGGFGGWTVSVRPQIDGYDGAAP